jgi:hypothetical protein
MSDSLEALRLQMEAAAAADDFETAARLRDQLSLLRGVDADPVGPINTSRLSRQVPGKMGLGTSDPKPKVPTGWKPPPKPDLMTTGKSRRRS